MQYSTGIFFWFDRRLLCYTSLSQTTLLGEAGGAGGVGASGGGGGEAAIRSRFESKLLNTASRDRDQDGEGKGGGGGSGGRGASSQSVRNDIKKSEKSIEKTSRHTGRDDRATVEQVLTLLAVRQS